MKERPSKLDKFIQDREELKKSPVINKSKNASLFQEVNPRVKSLEKKVEPKDVIKLTPERFKKVQDKLKASSAIKTKLRQAIQQNDKEATKKIIQQVGEVAKKTGNTELLSNLIKKVRKSNLAKKAGKKILSAVPFVGGALSALSSGDVKAAVPGLDFIDDLGPQKGSLDQRIESGNLTAQDIEALKGKQ